MTVSVKFCGAAGTVTGSCYLLSHPRGRLLVDCGMFQGSKTIRELNYGRFPFDPREIDAVLVTHAHIDHSGLIPKLRKAGYGGHFITTEGTRDLLTFMLPDSGHIQQTEVERLNRRNAKRGLPPVAPIYTRADAEEALTAIRGLHYDTWIEVGEGVRARFHNAGHILGSASIEMEIATGDSRRRLLRLMLSGDIGPGDKAFHPDPDAAENYDYVFVESTYGNRDRQELDAESRRKVLAEEVRAGLAAGGNVVIPAFAVERTQELLYDLAVSFDKGDLPDTRVFLDSPLAIDATRVFSEHLAETIDGAGSGNGGGDGNPFLHPSFHFTESVEQSKAIARVESGAIIIAASGMCDAGRIRHHLKNNLWSSSNTVILVGYQAAGTLGSLLEHGAKSVRIHGEEISVRARIRSIDVYSGHADRSQLIEWVRERLPVRGATFLVHGEEEGLEGLHRGLVEIGCDERRLFIPRLDESFTLTDGRTDRRPRRKYDQPPRLNPENVGALDWHNDYAAFLLDLQVRLRQMADDGTRQTLLRRLRGDLEETGTPPPRRQTPHRRRKQHR